MKRKKKTIQIGKEVAKLSFADNMIWYIEILSLYVTKNLSELMHSAKFLKSQYTKISYISRYLQ